MSGERRPLPRARMDRLRTIAEQVSLAIDFAGVAVIVLGLLFAVYRLARPPGQFETRYRQLRHDVGRGILLGLELMVAGDIIRTVAVEPTLDGVYVLGIIVLIRTFLSMSLEVELEGAWPWQRHRLGDASLRRGQREDAPPST